MEQIRHSEDFKETVIKVKSGQKRAKKVKRVIFKGDGSLDALFSRFLERLNVFWILHMSGTVSLESGSGFNEVPASDNTSGWARNPS